MSFAPLIFLAALVASSPPDEPVAARFAALAKEHDAKMASLYKAMHGTDDKAERAEIERTMHPDDAAYATQFLALASEEPNGPIAPDALYWVLQLQNGRISPIGQQALDRLARDFVSSPKLQGYLEQMARHSWPGMEDFLRDVLARNPHRGARGMACFGLAGMVAGHAAVPKIRNNPEQAEYLERTLDPGVLAAILRQDPAALLAEAVALHRRVVAEFADVRVFPDLAGDDRVLGPFAQGWLDNHELVAIGKVAPAIEGRDIDGRTFKLADYRGKVVVLVFWASWCGPCREQIPHERDLLARMGGRPFALLGVNGDRDPAAARKILARERMTWPNWYDRDSAKEDLAEGPIFQDYHIQGIPSVFVIDAEGVIRERDVRGVELERAVEEQLKRIKP